MIYEVDSVGFIRDLTSQLPLRPAFLEVALARVADELAAVDAQDIAIDYNSETGQVRFAVTVESDDPQDAVVQGSAIIRTALHAAGGHTPGWSVDWCEARAIRRVLLDA